jgi:hypothetical protein
MNGQVMADQAERTTKFMAYTLTVEGIITLDFFATNLDATWMRIRQALSVHGAALSYTGNGLGGFVMNGAPGGIKDVAWGPIPKVLEMKNLGGGKSSFIRWSVTIHLPEVTGASSSGGGSGGGTSTLTTVTGLDQLQRIVQNVGRRAAAFGGGGGDGSGPVLQFNYESSLTYDDDNYSGLSIRGTLEIPLTRTAADSRAVETTVDAFRQRWLNIAIDLENFRVIHRSFNYSRDKRTCEWEFVAEEIPPMGLPFGANTARGTMSVRDMKLGGGGNKVGASALCTWAISLRCTYTIRPDFSPRLAALAFWALWWFRMRSAFLGELPSLGTPNNLPQQPKPNLGHQIGEAVVLSLPVIGTAISGIAYYNQLFNQAKKEQQKKSTQAIPTGFGYDEGLYLDSKTITFQASWFLATTFSTLLRATGTWRWLPSSSGGQMWASSIKDIAGWRSWLSNQLDPNADVIVDFGGGDPPAT